MMTPFQGVFVNDEMHARVKFAGTLRFDGEPDISRIREFYGTFTLELSNLPKGNRLLFRRFAASEDTGLDLDFDIPAYGPNPTLLPYCNGKGFSIEVTRIEDSAPLPSPLKLEVSITILAYTRGKSVAVEWHSHGHSL
ncbi:hypothetical protein [Singulisphaera sp. PoT]|uniref:hypothetical protein n=1 Tax=Singulisphaera sp. PoT TaxID=3411797 RepID=UPI003BF4BA5A